MGYKHKKSEKCRRCFYSKRAEGEWICTYLYEEQKRRPCPAGDECTVNIPRGGRKTRAQKEMLI